jgi:hypothetical protein
MRIHAAHPDAGIDERISVSSQPPARVLVLYESTPSGAAALREAAALTQAGKPLAVVTLAPQSVASRCCARGPGVEIVNCVVRDVAEDELSEAREILGETAERATFKSLVGTRDPPFAKWAAANAFDLIVLPSRRLSIGGHPLARRLRRTTTAEVRLVG